MYIHTYIERDIHTIHTSQHTYIETENTYKQTYKQKTYIHTIRST